MKWLRLITVLCALVVGDLQAHGPWVTLNDCHYVANPANDGDSFHVRCGRKNYLFRLYFVDAPETDLGFPERVGEQAKYFGDTTPQMLQVGEAAKDFVRAQLSHPFIVRTCNQDALGRSKMERFYAFVEVDHGDLGERLVANGLARVHGTGTQPPGMSGAEAEWQKLEQLEHTAKEQKVGAWGVSAGRLNTRVASKEQYSADSFDAFFHPERSGATPVSVSVETSTTKPSTLRKKAAEALRKLGDKLDPAKKLDANTATEQELVDLPGIGKIIAERIIAARPFQTADDLRHVHGIGNKKYAAIRPYFQ